MFCRGNVSEIRLTRGAPQDHRAEHWTRSYESPTPALVRLSIPSHQNLSPSYSNLENEVVSNCMLTLENVTLDWYA